MTWLVWNVRQKELKLFMNSRKIKLAGLVETRVKLHNLVKLSFPGWRLITNHQHNDNGRICFTWGPTVYKVVAIIMTSQTIHCSILDIQGCWTCECTIVYGFNSIEPRKSLWAHLRSITQIIKGPWLISGNFNAVMYTNDRLFGSPIY